jgi:fumarylacetoacetate (FAA) hydrolase
MKLATYHDGSRDGQLIVVSRDLALAHYASGIATRLQQVLDDWNFMSPQLEELSQTLNHGKARHAFAFEPAKCLAPLPRAFRWAVGNAYVEQPDARLVDAAADRLLGPQDAIVCAESGLDLDFEAGLAVVTGDVPAGATPEAALEGVRLLLLANDLHLRARADHPGPGASRFATAFGPVAVTPDELGPAWSGGRVHLKLDVAVNGKRFGLVDAGAEMRVHFGELIARLARNRALSAGSLVGSGPVHNADPSRGFASIAVKWEMAAGTGADADGATPGAGFMKPGDTLRIDLRGSDGNSVFGAIEQRVVAAT